MSVEDPETPVAVLGVVLHALALGFGLIILTGPTHAKTAVKVLPFICAAAYGFLDPASSKWPSGPGCEPLFGFTFLQFSPGCILIQSLASLFGMTIPAGSMAEKILMAACSGVLVQIIYQYGLKSLFQLAVVKFLDTVNPFADSKIGRFLSIPVYFIIAQLATAAMNPIMWLLSPLTAVLYPLIGTLLTMYGGEYFFDGEWDSSNNCVTYDNLRLWGLLKGKGVDFDLEQCSPYMKAIAAVLCIGGVCWHIYVLLGYYERGVMGEAFTRTTSGDLQCTIDGGPGGGGGGSGIRSNRTARSPSPAPNKSRSVRRSPSPGSSTTSAEVHTSAASQDAVAVPSKTQDPVMAMKVEELKEALRAQGKPVNGKKAELQKRLMGK